MVKDASELEASIASSRTSRWNRRRYWSPVGKRRWLGATSRPWCGWLTTRQRSAFMGSEMAWANNIGLERAPKSMTQDIDVVVPVDDAFSALRVLQKAGFRSLTPVNPRQNPEPMYILEG